MLADSLPFRKIAHLTRGQGACGPGACLYLGSIMIYRSSR